MPVVMGTLSKALGAQGGYVAGDRDLCDYLRTRDRGFVFTTALAPAAAGAALAALDIVRDEPERRARLHALVARLVEGARALGYTVLPTDSAVVGRAHRRGRRRPGGRRVAARGARLGARPSGRRRCPWARRGCA